MIKRNTPVKKTVTPINEEHIDAVQIEVDKKREAYIATLDEEKAAKFKAVDEACKILEDHDVDYWMFPFMIEKGLKEDEVVLTQYNSLRRKLKYDESGKVKEESQKFARFFNESLIEFVFAQYFSPELNHIAGCEIDSNEALFSMHFLMKRISEILNRQRKAVNDKHL